MNTNGEMELKKNIVDLIMHYTNPLWVMCRLMKIVGRKRAMLLVGGEYNRVWCLVFKK